MTGDGTMSAIDEEVPLVGRSPVPVRTMDFLRGIAACYVVLNHTRGSLFVGGKLMLAAGQRSWLDYVAIAALQMTSLGHEAVVLFFVLSGFAMAHSVSNRSTVLRFYQKRLVRVWLPYVIAVLFAAFACWVVSSLDPTSQQSSECAAAFCSPVYVAGTILYLSPTTTMTPQFWSLPFEIIFYLLCPLILFSKRSITVSSAVAAIGLMVSLALYGIAFNPSGWTLLNFIFCELGLFMIGVNSYLHFHRIPRLAIMPLLLFLAGALGFIVAFRTYHGSISLVTDAVMALITPVIVRSLPAAVGHSRWNVGRFSYSIYIFHYAFLAMIFAGVVHYTGLQRDDMNSYWAWMLALPIIFFGCWMLWFVSERPANQWLSRIRQRERAAVARRVGRPANITDVE